MGTAFPETKNRSDPCQSQSLLQANESSNPCYHPHPGNSVNDDSAGEMPRVSRIAKKIPVSKFDDCYSGIRQGSMLRSNLVAWGLFESAPC